MRVYSTWGCAEYVSLGASQLMKVLLGMPTMSDLGILMIVHEADFLEDLATKGLLSGI
jgi:hypothetical protein